MIKDFEMQVMYLELSDWAQTYHESLKLKKLFPTMVRENIKVEERKRCNIAGNKRWRKGS